MFLGGKFRKHYRRRNPSYWIFEAALAKALNLDECWAKILDGTREFGFQGVRLNLHGRVFEELGPRNGHPIWQLRIPLPDAHYVNFFRDFNSEMNQLIMSAFVSSDERGLKNFGGAWPVPRLPALAPELIRMPAAAQLYYTARAGAAAEVVSANGD